MASKNTRAGKCTNFQNGCTTADSNKIVELNILEDFECPECGKELSEVQKKAGLSMGLIAGVAGVVVVLGLAAGSYFTKFPASLYAYIDADSRIADAQRDSIARADSIKIANIEAFKVADNIFSGELKGGQPNGIGRLDFRKERLIDMHDDAQRYAMAGDYIVGEWDNGHLIHGKLYGAAGNIKATLIFGVTLNPEKDHIFNSYAIKVE